MFQMQLTSKVDVHHLKDKLRHACDEQGIRLGKDQHKAEAILATLLGVKDYNTLLGMASKPVANAPVDPKSIQFYQFVSIVERVNVPSTTYGAAAKVMERIKSAKGIKLIVFAVRDGELNNSATSILIVAESGSFLFDQTLITVERRPRELELVDIFSVLQDKGVLDLTRYIPKRVGKTSTRSCIEVAQEMVNTPLEPIFPDWQGFLAMYSKELKRYGPGIFADDSWDEFKEQIK
ncbi:hypothetical protein [Pseudoalteromonas sp. A757]|uniref:hypothetical protein n=1 Tax=Pseudoalteromonas sp. A757 TaxID=2250709 RepID=UPI000FFF5B84|nr:hypothetical protein [Pseudoalteromonas sp. A757]RXE85946.1 hypothetical protein DRB05_13555 [Pseudoalteromonas sp. A757]